MTATAHHHHHPRLKIWTKKKYFWKPADVSLDKDLSNNTLLESFQSVTQDGTGGFGVDLVVEDKIDMETVESQKILNLMPSETDLLRSHYVSSVQTETPQKTETR